MKTNDISTIPKLRFEHTMKTHAISKIPKLRSENILKTTEISTISTSITDQTPTEEELTPDPPNILKTPLDPIKKVVDDDQLKKSLIKGLSLTADTSTGLIYYPEETTKTQITLHHTAVTNAKIETIVRNWTKLNSKVSTHFIINRKHTNKWLNGHINIPNQHY